MDLGALLRLGHALSGVSFVAGLVGLWIVTGLARRADSLATMRLLLRAANPFGTITSASGISATILGLATAFAYRRPLFGPLQGARADWMFVSTVLVLPILAFLVLVYPRFVRRLRAALQAADGEGQITPELTAAWADPIHTLARRYELAAVIAVLALMIAKPF